MGLKFAVALAFMVMMTSTMIPSEAEVSPAEQKCRTTLLNMTDCLPFVTGKAAAPTPACCHVANKTTHDLTNKDCLCSFLARVHQGDPETADLGILEADLVRLPALCQFHGVRCPKLAPLREPDRRSVGGRCSMLGVALKIETLVMAGLLIV